MLDTHLLDALLDDPGLSALVRSHVDDRSVELLVTHLQLDEVAEMPEARAERREALNQLLATLPATRLPTYGFVLDRSRLGEARLTDDQGASLIERLRGGSLDHTEDAVIAATAWREGVVLVTEDRTARGRAIREGIDAVSVTELRQRLARLS